MKTKKNIVLHHDNAPSHTADDTQLEITVLGYSSEWFTETYSKWIERNRKFVQCKDEYFEEWIVINIR